MVYKSAFVLALATLAVLQVVNAEPCQLAETTICTTLPPVSTSVCGPAIAKPAYGHGAPWGAWSGPWNAWRLGCGVGCGLGYGAGCGLGCGLGYGAGYARGYGSGCGVGLGHASTVCTSVPIVTSAGCLGIGTGYYGRGYGSGYGCGHWW